jgi:hypothetical protein
VVEQDGDGAGSQAAAAEPIVFDEEAIRHGMAGDDLMSEVIRLFCQGSAAPPRCHQDAFRRAACSQTRPNSCAS